MSWEEYKRKKKQLSEEDIGISTEDSSKLSSWEKFKQEKEKAKANIVTTKIEEDTDSWFKSGAFNDGYQFGDLTKTTLGTVGDVGVGLVKGASSLVEGVGDLVTYGAADVVGLFGNENKANQMRTNARKSTVDELFSPLESVVDKNSVLGDKSDSIVEGLGYVAAVTAISIATAGAGTALGASGTAATIGSTTATFTSAMGNSMSEALNDGASLEEARIYGIISGAAEAGSELMFGGLGKASKAMGLSNGALDDVVIGGLTKGIKNKLTKTIIQSGLKAGGEGFEEVVSGFISAIGKKATYMNEKELKEILSNEKLGEQFWMGALTSAIAQGPSTMSSVRHGTDYITGRTDNEQKVYDRELKTRTDEKIREATIEQAYNEQIKTQENLGVKLTEEAKAEIMQKVEKAYDNGTLKSNELSKKDLTKIQEEVEADMEEGNISVDTIMNTLGENQDISKDRLLQRSMYENEQRYNSYKVEQTDNEKVNVLMQSAADAGMNNTSKTRKRVELISKLVKDTDRQYKFASPEQLKEMGYNENANGLIDKSTGEILINSHSDKGIQAIVGHETTHIFDSKNEKGEYSKEYLNLQDMAIEYAKAKGIYDNKVQSITKAYGTLLTDESQIKEELTADLVGDFLFNDTKFIENLAVKDRNIFQKIYDYIKHAYKVATAGTEEAKALENLKYQFEKVYKTISEETNTDTKYSIAGKKAMNNAVMADASNIVIEKSYNKAQQMAKNNIDNEIIRKTTNWFQDKNGDWKFEFSDKDMTLKNVDFKEGKTYKLKDILEHDILFMAYPELANYDVQIENMSNKNAYFSRKNKAIKINSKIINSKSAEGTLIHEIQHAIQQIEGFEGGARTKKSKLAYYNKLGEIEADNTKQRYLAEKSGDLDRYLEAPESSKANPKHSKLDKYLKNRNIIDKIKDGIYNYFNNISNGGGNNYEISEENMEQVNENTGPNILQTRGEDVGPIWRRLGSKRRGILENDVEKSNEINQEDIGEYFERNKTLVDERGRIKETLKESENNSDSFSTIRLSMTDDTRITGDDIATRDMLKEEKNTIEDEVGESNITKTDSKEELNNSGLLEYLDKRHIDYATDENGKIISIENEEAIKDYYHDANEEQTTIEKETISNSIERKYKLMEIGKREYEKLLRREKPTEKEKITVDRLIKGEIEDNEIPASVNRQRVVDLYNAKVKFYSVEQEIKAQRKEIVKKYRDLAKNMTKNIFNWKDKKRGIQYQINTMKRNLRDIIPNKSEADALYNEYFKPINKNNATIENEINKYNGRISKFNINNVESQYIQMIGENKYNSDSELPIEKIEEFYDNNKNRIDIKKCQEAVQEFRNIYDELIVKINKVLIENGYKPIEYRKGYFPHFVENKAETMLGKFAEKLGWKVNADTLPTDIAGITAQFRPGKAWTAFSQQRKGDNTDYNALKGYDNYIRGAMDVIYHTKDIQKLRALENEIRYQYSEKGIQEQIDSIYNDHESTIEEKEQKINEIFENNKNNPMGNLATELRNYTDNLANKKARGDRSMEQDWGRQTYSIMTNIHNRVSANMVGANISSALTNFIPITQAWSQTSTKNIMRAMKESIAIQYQDDGFSKNSTFLTNRTEQAERLYKTGLDKASDKLGYMFDVVDSFTSNVIVRAKYYDNIDAGMNTYEALDNADEFAKDVIAGRSKGDMPTIFNKKNPVVKLFTAFQLEVNNQYGYMLKDLPIDLGGEAKEKLVGAFVKMFLGAYLYNLLSEKITGRKSAFSPIDIALDGYKTISNDELSTGEKINTIGEDLIGEVPFIGGIAGGGRLSIQGAIPYDNPISMISGTISNASDLLDGDKTKKQTAIKSLLKEWTRPLYYIALPFAGGQLKKTIEGTSMFLNDVPGSYTDSGDLRYTVEDDVGSKVQAALFGAYANPYSQDYIESGFKTIKKDNIEEMVGLDMNSTEYREFKKNLSKVSDTSDKNGYKQYKDENNNTYWYDDDAEIMYDSKYKKTTLTEDDLIKVSKKEEALNYIDSLDLTDSQKNLVANNLNKSAKKKIDMSEYSDYSSYEEYTYARDYPKKYSVISNIDTYDKYQEYQDEITEIKKAYSTELGYTSKQRKEAVQSYINDLELNMYQKIMLERMAGGYSIKNYKNYIYEYLESLNLTNDEKYVIWEELFN